MATQLLLIEDVEDLGRSGDVVKVKPGYARNFLLPQGLGVIASKGTLRMQERLQEERRKKAIEEKKEAEAIAQKLEGSTITTKVKVDHSGHLYGSVSSLDILQLVKEQLSVEIEKKAVPLKSPIKKLGSHAIELVLSEDVTATITLNVESEGGPTAVEEAPEAEVTPEAEAEIPEAPEEL